MFWFEEDNSNWPYRKSFYRIKRLLYSGQTPYQQIDVCDLEYYGRALFLDRALQFTEFDEALYHEMFVHPAAGAVKPEHVCILGGGDGGVCREILKHSSVKKVYLCDIDEEVIEVCKKFFPEMGFALEDKRVIVHVNDAQVFIKDFSNQFDLVFVDLTDISDSSAHLYSEEFINNIKSALKPSGVLVMQTSGVYFARDSKYNSFSLNKMFKKFFKFVSVSSVLVPCFTDGDNSYTYASDEFNFNELEFIDFENINLKFYTAKFAKSSFALPLGLQQIIYE